MVNGVTGVNDGGSWNAENVPNASGGVSIFKVTSYSSAVPSASGSTVDPTDNPDSSSSTNAEVTFEKPVAELLCIADDMSGDFYEHSLYTNTGYIYDGKRFQHFNQYWNYGGGGRGFETNYDYLIERSFDQDWTSQTNDWIFGPAYGWITWTNKLYPYGGNIEIAPNDLGLHQLVGMEHCDVWNCSPPTDSPGAGYLYSYTRHYRRTAQTHMRLFVGGRDIGPYIIWLNGWAHDIANIELRNFPVGGEWHTTYTPIWIQPSMPYGMIVIGGVGPLDPEGRVRLTAWPGEEVDVTPAVAGHVFYTFQVGLGSVDPMPD